MEIVFTNPQYLWLSLGIPVLAMIHLATLKKSRSLALKFSNFEALEKVSRGAFLGTPYKGLLTNRNLFLLLIRAITYLILILAISGPIVYYYGKASNFDFVLAIDASSSMLADDFKPYRLEAAKEAALIFVDSIPNKAKIGVVSFSGTVFIEQKLTNELNKVKDVIRAINIKESGGTNIGDALITSANLFGGDNPKVVVLLTDGQSNVGTQVEDAIKYAKENNVQAYTIGVATKEGGNISDLSFVSKIDEETLQAIATLTGGKYFRAENEAVLNKAFNDVALSTVRRMSLDASWILLMIGLISLSLEWFIVSVKYKTIP